MIEERLDLVIALFSNDRFRNWPIGHFEQVAESWLASSQRSTISLVGGQEHFEACQKFARGLSKSGRVRNLAGTTSWTELETFLTESACVLGNNSGVVHLASSLGVATVCVFSGTVSAGEWMPLGNKTSVIWAEVPCAPCANPCAFELRCLREISASVVIREVMRLSQT